MQERLIGGGVAAAIFLPLLFIGGLPFQLLVGAMAMIAVSEMLRMKHLEMFSIEGVLSMLAAFILVVPIDHYFNSLPTDASVTGFAIISFLILAGTVLNSDHYSFDDAVYPITSAFYVGFGFQNLIAARLDSWEKVLFALFIVWSMHPIVSSGCLSVRFSLVSSVNLVTWLNQLLNDTLVLKTQVTLFLDTVAY